MHPLAEAKSPFAVEGARNVFLETIKRGEFDDYSASESGVTVILRLYEAYGGHGTVKLQFAPHLAVAKVLVTNLLEDTLEEHIELSVRALDRLATSAMAWVKG